MPQFTRSVHIARPQGEVWMFLDDREKAKLWVQGVDRVEKRTDGAVRVGTVFSETRTLGRRTETFDLVVTAYDAPRLFGVKAIATGGEFEYRYTLAPEGAATRVDLLASARATGFFGKLFIRMGSKMMEKYDGDQLDRLKAAIEATKA